MNNNTYISDESAGLITMRDPCVLPDNGTYYLVRTQPPYRNGVNDGENVEGVFFLPVTYLNDGNVKIETD